MVSNMHRAWFEWSCQSLLSNGFTKSNEDYGMFYHTSSKGCVLLLFYIDDMIITESDTVAITSLKKVSPQLV